MGADLFESYVGAVVATIVIAAAGGHNEIALMAIPIILIAIGSFASVVGSKSVEWMKDLEPQIVLRRATFYAGGIYLAASLVVMLAVGLVDGVQNILWIWLASVLGLLSGIAIGLLTEYYTSSTPVRKIAEASQTGVATNIIEGLSVGMISTTLPVIAVAVAICFRITSPGSTA